MITSRSGARTAFLIIAAFLTGCSVAPSTAAPRTIATTSTISSADAGIIQLRPVIPPKGAVPQTCPVGEALSTCTGTFNLTSWYHSPSQCLHSASTVNPEPNRLARLYWHSQTSCLFLAPATYVLTNAASVNTDLQPLQGEPGIEITVSRSDATALDAAIGKSFKQPLAIVADGQMIYSFVPEPTNAQYVPMGDLLIFYPPTSLLATLDAQLQIALTSH